MIWEGPVKFDGCKAKLDLKTMKGYEKFLPLKITFYKKSTGSQLEIDDKGDNFFSTFFSNSIT